MLASMAKGIPLTPLRRTLDAGRHVAAEVDYRGWTPLGELRHAVFKGWVEE